MVRKLSGSKGFGRFHKPIKRSPAIERTDAAGKVWDSKREMRRGGELRMLELTGQVRNVRAQVPYHMVLTTQHGSVEMRRPWKADFVYERLIDGEWREVVEDVGEFDTDMARLTRKLMLAIHGITVLTVK